MKKRNHNDTGNEEFFSNHSVDNEAYKGHKKEADKESDVSFVLERK